MCAVKGSNAVYKMWQQNSFQSLNIFKQIIGAS
jgi:hypothetical protein